MPNIMNVKNNFFLFLFLRSNLNYNNEAILKISEL